MIGLTIGAAVGGALVGAVATNDREERFEAVSRLRIEVESVDTKEWLRREGIRMRDHGPALIEVSGFVDVERPLVISSEVGLRIAARAATEVEAIEIANALLGVAITDRYRTVSATFHDDLRLAELAAGVPSPRRAQRPHLVVPADMNPLPSSSMSLADLKAQAMIELSQLAQPAHDAARLRAPRWATAAGSSVAAALVALLVMVGPPHRWRWLLLLHDPGTQQREHSPTSQRFLSIALLLCMIALVPGPGPVAATIALTAFAIGWGLRAWVRSPSDGLTIVLWIWLLSPLAERLIEWQDRDAPTDLVRATPVLLTVAILPLLVRRFDWRLPVARVIGWSAGPAALAVVVGLVEHGPRRAISGAGVWLAPIAVAALAASTLRTDIAATITGWFRTASIGTGAYAIVQFVWVPPWDSAWLDRTTVASFGRAESFGLRVFSTTASPAAFGAFCMCALLLAAVVPHRHQVPSVVLAAVPLALTLHRTSWVGAAIGLTILAMRRGAGTQRRVIVAGALVMIVGAMAVAPVRDRVTDSASSGLEDRSITARVDHHRDVLRRLVQDPLGSGFGSTGTGARIDGAGGSNDSTILDMMRTFGWSAIAAFAASVMWVARRRPRVNTTLDLADAGWLAILALAVTVPLTNVLESTSGALTWAVFAIATATRPGATANSADLLRDTSVAGTREART